VIPPSWDPGLLCGNRQPRVGTRTIGLEKSEPSVIPFSPFRLLMKSNSMDAFVNGLPHNIGTHFPGQLIHLDLDQAPRGLIWGAMDYCSHEAAVQVIRKIPVTAAALHMSFRGFLVEIERTFPYPIKNVIFLHQCSGATDESLKLDRVVLLFTPRQCPDSIQKALGVLMQRVRRRIAEGWFTQESLPALVRRYNWEQSQAELGGRTPVQVRQECFEQAGRRHGSAIHRTSAAA